MTPKLNSPTLIVPKGVFAHPLGAQVIDDAAIGRIISSFKERAGDIVVDYRHESMNRCGHAHAAGWVKVCSARVTPDGVEAVIDWNGEARGLIESKKYLYLSPVFEMVNGHITALVNLGLTNNPNIHAMPQLVNELSTMEKPMHEIVQNVRKLLSLGEDADGAAIADAVTALVDEHNNAPTLISLLGDVVTELGVAPGEGDGAVIERIRALAAESAQHRQGHVETVVNDAIAAGLIRPSQREWAVNLGQNNPGSFRLFLANSGPAAPLGGIITPDRPGEPALSDGEARVCRSLGLSSAEYLGTESS